MLVVWGWIRWQIISFGVLIPTRHVPCQSLDAVIHRLAALVSESLRYGDAGVNVVDRGRVPRISEGDVLVMDDAITHGAGVLGGKISTACIHRPF